MSASAPERPTATPESGAPAWSAVVLDNGLRVLAQRSDRAPVAAVYLWLEAGTADETPEIAGVAHFLEHMVFKGTARRGVGESA
ncbi:MAG TPA: insulinase family protein, partial [Polyangiaceae bacterium]|nr:insulinase family protein [Polyangiaceae bacterium]